METNEEIEMLLWAYMDGTCSEADMHRVSVLIARDEVWVQKYNELSALHTTIAGNLQTEQPSMRFTKNVMDAVAQVHIAPATKQYINKGIIRGIAAFFILTITTLIGYALINAGRHTNAAGAFATPALGKIDISTLFNSSTFLAIITINVVLGLVLLDMFLHRKHSGLMKKIIN